MLRVPAGPSSTLIFWLSSRKPGCDTVSVYLPGARKKNLYTPSLSVLADWIVPLVLSRISTLASGTTASLGSLTTPLSPPEVVVCALRLFGQESKRSKVGNRKSRGLKSIETLQIFPIEQDASIFQPWMSRGAPT